jgi:hypothetical protein
MRRGRAAATDPDDAGMLALRATMQEGKFYDISLNTFASAAPAGYPGEPALPWNVWCGKVFAKDFGPLGASVTTGSGHQNDGDKLASGVSAFDFYTRRFSFTNMPAAGLMTDYVSTFFDHYEPLHYFSKDAGFELFTYWTHTYSGLAYQSKDEGGGPKGSILKFFTGGGTAKNDVQRYDLSQPNGPPTIVIDVMQIGTKTTGTYPMVMKDEETGLLHVMSFDGVGPMKTVDPKNNYAVTTNTGVQYSVSQNNNMIYLGAPYNCGVMLGPDPFATLDNDLSIRVSVKSGGVFQPPVKVAFAGSYPATRDVNSSTHMAEGSGYGGSWCAPMNYIAIYPGTGSTVWKLTPPPADQLLTGTWTFTNEVVVGNLGQEMSNPGLNPNTGFTLPYTNNGVWNGFIWVPSIKAFAWHRGRVAPMQAVILQGMNSI